MDSATVVMIPGRVVARGEARLAPAVWPERLFDRTFGMAPHSLALFANAVDLVDQVANPFRPRRFPFRHTE
jgi:hypothetical protein